MDNGAFSPRTPLRLSACLLLAGQVLYIAVTQFHEGGDANDHYAIFATYADDDIWAAVHVGQFAAMAILLAGLIALALTLDAQRGAARWLSRLGAAAAAATLALYGVLQAVDGVALKQAVNAWASAPEAEKAARFAMAEGIRWLEWGLRSYQDFALGLALILLAAPVATDGVPRPISYLMALTGIAYLVQGWLAGSEGFSLSQSVAIVMAWATGVTWMTWLAIIAWRMQESDLVAPSFNRRSAAPRIPAGMETPFPQEFEMANRKSRWGKMLWIAPAAILAAGSLAYGAMSMMTPPDDLDLALSKMSAGGAYVTTITPNAEPISVGPIHTWTVELKTADGNPVEGASIAIDGGMPQHGHGLPTAPEVTKSLGDGRYLVEGMKFNMPGWWTIEVEVDGPAGQDETVFNLVL